MKIDMSVFQKIHRELYCSNSPGYSGALAFWKLEKLCDDAEAFYLPEYGCYYVIRNKHLLIYYSPDALCHIPIEELNSLDCISMKAEMFDTIKHKLPGFNVNYGENLHYDKNYVPPAFSSDMFSIVEFNFSNEEHYEIAAKCINGLEEFTDTAGNFTDAHIKRIKANYISCSVFAPELWFLIQDKQTKKLVGSAISTYQKCVKETLLDWIYILPQYQGKGAGRFMMQEIIRRSIGRSDIIQVGGTVEFYKKCGFYTKKVDVWAPKPGYSFHAPSICP